MNEQMDRLMIRQELRGKRRSGAQSAARRRLPTGAFWLATAARTE
jgi:hypothetical protein